MDKKGRNIDVYSILIDQSLYFPELQRSAAKNKRTLICLCIR